jgi:hypothetical protein
VKTIVDPDSGKTLEQTRIILKDYITIECKIIQIITSLLESDDKSYNTIRVFYAPNDAQSELASMIGLTIMYGPSECINIFIDINLRAKFLNGSGIK